MFLAVSSLKAFLVIVKWNSMNWSNSHHLVNMDLGMEIHLGISSPTFVYRSCDLNSLIMSEFEISELVSYHCDRGNFPSHTKDCLFIKYGEVTLSSHNGKVMVCTIHANQTHGRFVNLKVINCSMCTKHMKLKLDSMIINS